MAPFIVEAEANPEQGSGHFFLEIILAMDTRWYCFIGSAVIQRILMQRQFVLMSHGFDVMALTVLLMVMLMTMAKMRILTEVAMTAEWALQAWELYCQAASSIVYSLSSFSLLEVIHHRISDHAKDKRKSHEWLREEARDGLQCKGLCYLPNLCLLNSNRPKRILVNSLFMPLSE